jgi:archaellum biogenesis ATPase FlaH
LIDGQPMEDISYTREQPLYYMEEFLSQKIHDVGSAGIVFGASGLGKTSLMASTAARTIEKKKKVCHISHELALPQFLDTLQLNLEKSVRFSQYLLAITLPIDVRYRKYYKKVPLTARLKTIQLESQFTQFHLLDVIVRMKEVEGCDLFLFDSIDDLDPFRIKEGVLDSYHVNQFTYSLLSNGITVAFTSVYNHQIQVNTRIELKEVHEREGQLQRVAIIHKGIRPSHSKEYINYQVHGTIVFDYSTARIV